MSWSNHEQYLLDYPFTGKQPKSVTDAAAFLAAVEALIETLIETPSGSVDLTQADAATLPKLLEAAVAAEVGGPVRARLLADLRKQAQETYESIVRTELLPLITAEVVADFDAAGAELAAELEAWPGVGPGAIADRREPRADKLREVIARLDTGARIRGRAQVTNDHEAWLAGVCVLENDWDTAIDFVNRRGRMTPGGAEFWLTAARFPGISAIKWRTDAEIAQGPLHTKARAAQRKVQANAEHLAAERRRVRA